MGACVTTRWSKEEFTPPRAACRVTKVSERSSRPTTGDGAPPQSLHGGAGRCSIAYEADVWGGAYREEEGESGKKNAHASF